MNITATNTSQEVRIGNVNGAYFNLMNNRFDFGTIKLKKNPNIPIKVKFTNSGKAPLVILKADVSCGCLSVEFPETPIYPNEKGEITINVDTRGQQGIFNKTIFFKTTAENEVELIRIIGNIKK